MRGWIWRSSGGWACSPCLVLDRVAFRFWGRVSVLASLQFLSVHQTLKYRDISVIRLSAFDCFSMQML